MNSSRSGTGRDLDCRAIPADRSTGFHLMWQTRARKKPPCQRHCGRLPRRAEPANVLSLLRKDSRARIGYTNGDMIASVRGFKKNPNRVSPIRPREQSATVARSNAANSDVYPRSGGRLRSAIAVVACPCPNFTERGLMSQVYRRPQQRLRGGNVVARADDWSTEGLEECNQLGGGQS